MSRGAERPVVAGTSLVAVAAGLMALALYLWLAPPVSGDRDSSELTLVLALDGIAHPTGYPLYTLLGHRFVGALHALGLSWPYAANAWSALGGAVAIALMVALGAALVPPATRLPAAGRAGLALPAAALFLLNPAWTGETTLAEVYSWHQAWVMGTGLYFVLLTRGLGAAALPRVTMLAHAAGWGLLAGAGLAHHASSVLVSGPLTLVLLARCGRIPRARLAPAVATAAVATLVPIASYLILYAKAVHSGPAQWIFLEPTWTGLWRHVTGAQYQGAFGRFAPVAAHRQMLASDVYPFLIPGLVLLLVSALRARDPGERWTLGALAGVATIQTAIAFLYGVDDPTSYFLPPLAFGLLSIAPLGAGLAASGPRARAWAAGGGAALGILALALSVSWTRTALDLHAAHAGLDAMLRSMWRGIPHERGIVLWRHDMHHRLKEYQLLDGQKPGLEVVNLWNVLDPVVRKKFRARHGFDPIGDRALPVGEVLRTGPESPDAREFFGAVTRRINGGTPLPVIRFDPEVPEVIELRKPAAAESPRPRISASAATPASPTSRAR